MAKVQFSSPILNTSNDQGCSCPWQMSAYFFREIGHVPPAFVANFPPRAWGVDIGHLQGKRTSGLMEMMDQIISCKSHIYIYVYIYIYLYTISLGLVSSSQVLDGKVQWSCELSHFGAPFYKVHPKWRSVCRHHPRGGTCRLWGHLAVSHRSFPLSTIYCTAGIHGLLCFRKRYPKSPLCPRLWCDVLDTTMLSLSRLGPLFGIKGSLSVLCSPHPLLPIKVINDSRHMDVSDIQFPSYGCPILRHTHCSYCSVVEYD